MTLIIKSNIFWIFSEIQVRVRYHRDLLVEFSLRISPSGKEIQRIIRKRLMIIGGVCELSHRLSPTFNYANAIGLQGVF